MTQRKFQRQNDRILRLPEVRQVTGLGKTTIYDQENRGLFPKRLKLTERTCGWWQSEVLEWLKTRPRAA